ncbi:hypothetical protein PanWU01x14_280060 [Parasponia andersonii]|uniref:Uncharacterized protein n=1 Tax=Parasponia andersonii TaxID=3476 RepID=A0A2P5B1P3_PARAD|nr:hypothetical protein PanWU01x14_280060 [Parasponia andersonii]
MTVKMEDKKNNDELISAVEGEQEVVYKERSGASDRGFPGLKSAEAAEQESGESSEEVESPRSVGRLRRLVHSQILRIREEDSHLGEDFGERETFSANIINNNNNNRVSSLDVVFFSRPILPCSPLGGKTTVKALH